MNPEIKAQWVAALKSGEYKQGRFVLHNRETNEYCCLGVLCDLAVKAGVEVEQREDVTWVGGEPAVGERREVPSTSFGGMSQALPAAVISWAGVDDDDPMPEGESNSLSTMNDRSHTFGEIADVIERGL